RRAAGGPAGCAGRWAGHDRAGGSWGRGGARAGGGGPAEGVGPADGRLRPRLTGAALLLEALAELLLHLPLAPGGDLLAGGARADGGGGGLATGGRLGVDAAGAQGLQAPSLEFGPAPALFALRLDPAEQAAEHRDNEDQD